MLHLLAGPLAALIDCYVEAASGPATLTEACAHHLPAVAANLGPECWPRLKCELLLAPLLLGCGQCCVRGELHGAGRSGTTGWNLQRALAATPPLPPPAPLRRDAVRALAASEYVSVRVALAERVAELAALLGRERVAADLLPVIQARHLRLGAASAFAGRHRVRSPACRQTYLRAACPPTRPWLTSPLSAAPPRSPTAAEAVW